MQEQPQHKVTKIESVNSEEEASKLLDRGWIFLGFYRQYFRNDISDKHMTEVPTFVMGRV